MEDSNLSIACVGGHRYKGNSVYVGSWNNEGDREGEGHLLFPDGTRYDGCFERGLFHGLGVLSFPDSSRYEGEFCHGWFHGYGVYWRSDGMRYQGEFRGGKIYGLGLTTFNDNSNGFPRNEGFFQECQLKKQTPCPEVIQKAKKLALEARSRFL